MLPPCHLPDLRSAPLLACGHQLFFSLPPIYCLPEPSSLPLLPFARSSFPAIPCPVGAVSFQFLAIPAYVSPTNLIIRLLKFTAEYFFVLLDISGLSHFTLLNF